MVDFLKQINIQIAIFIALIGVLFLMTRDWSSQEERQTKALMQVWAEKLDRNVKASGVYIQWDGNELPENDAWGTPLKVEYKNEGVAERLFVGSAGEDKLWGSKDDLRVSKMQINAKGIGEGIKENTQEISQEATKGAMKELSGKVDIQEISSKAAKGFLKGIKEELQNKE